MARLPLVLALTCLGSGATLLGGRALLSLIPAPDPNTPTPTLERLRRFSPDPERRRETSLLLLPRLEKGDLAGERRLLSGQGWGGNELAALVLKRDALATEALGDQAAAQQNWQLLVRRFPDTPTSADGLYALGRQQPQLRQKLSSHFAFHPAALAAAVEAGPSELDRLQAALHLADHGVRWPGAEPRLREACQSKSAVATPSQRDKLARGLAQLGDSAAALSCLKDSAPSQETQLSLSQALLGGDREQQAQAQSLLLQLTKSAPLSSQASKAAAMLSEQPGPRALQALKQLPSALQDTAPIRARLAMESGDIGATLNVLQRWPSDPASWELQWQQARLALLKRQWATATTLLSSPIGRKLPVGLVGRQLFWLGFSQKQQGTSAKAQQTWIDLIKKHPGGYYGWRAAVRLSRGNLNLNPRSSPALLQPRWHPLGSGDWQIDQLWRLGQPLEAWEHWRTKRNSPPSSPLELIVEGRLRRAVGDHWIGRTDSVVGRCELWARRRGANAD